MSSHRNRKAPVPETDPPTGGGFGQTGPTAHVPSDEADVSAGEAQLDDALRETFPASDPISPGAAAASEPAPPPAPDEPAATAPVDPGPVPFPTRESMAAKSEGAGGDSGG